MERHNHLSFQNIFIPHPPTMMGTDSPSPLPWPLATTSLPSVSAGSPALDTSDQ